MEYRLARTYEEQGYKIISDSIRTENNKLYVDVECKCYKCGGTGRIPYFGHIDDGVCFACCGRGKFYKEHCRVYTEDERLKMDAAAERRKEKKLEEAKAQAEGKIKAWKEKYNISDGHIFIVAGCNTYDIKDLLKEQGAKFYSGLGWFFGTTTAPVEKDINYPEGAFLFHVDFDSILYFNDLGGGPYYKEGALAEMKKDILDCIKANNKEKSTSQHFGEVGERIRKVKATYVGAKYIDGEWGGSFLYTFRLGDNIATWFSQSVISEDIHEGDEIILSGTVKAHTEYNGILQTQLNRCIVKKEG